MEHDLLALARELSRRAAAAEVYLEADPQYRRFLAALEQEHRLASLCKIWAAGAGDEVDPEYILFPTLKRLAQIVKPDPYLYLSIHALAEWVGTATSEERSAFLRRAAETAPDDEYVLWEQLRAAAPSRAIEQRPILERLRRTAPDSPLIEAAFRDLDEHPDGLSSDMQNQIAREMPHVNRIPLQELCDRLEPRSDSNVSR
jgi:hypothetical protein